MIFLSFSLCLLVVCHAVKDSDVIIKQVPSPRSYHGKGPHWDVSTQSLYYIDINGTNCKILRYSYRENKTYGATVDNVKLMTFIIPIEDSADEFIVGANRSVKIIRWDGNSTKGEFIRDLFEPKFEIFLLNRWNDAKCDPMGRLFGGTQRDNFCKPPFGERNASLYRYDGLKDCIKTLKSNVLVSNGMTWVSQTYKFYYIDSCAFDIKEYDYNIYNGDLSNERSILTLDRTGELADYGFDGMTSDIAGNIFVALYNGGRIMKIEPSNGTMLGEYKIPLVNFTTSVAFGGPNLDILFVTTASNGNDTPKQAGHLYQISGLGTMGTPAIKFKLYDW